MNQEEIDELRKLVKLSFDMQNALLIELKSICELNKKRFEDLDFQIKALWQALLHKKINED